METIPAQAPAAAADAAEAPPRQASLEAPLQQQEPVQQQQQQPEAQPLRIRVRQLSTLKPANCLGSSTSQPAAGRQHGLYWVQLQASVFKGFERVLFAWRLHMQVVDKGSC